MPKNKGMTSAQTKNVILYLFWLGKGGKNRRRAKKDDFHQKRLLIFKEDLQGNYDLTIILFNVNIIL